MKEICSSNHTYKFEHKVKPHLWEKKYEQEVIANEVIDATTEGEKFEEAFYANIAKGTFLHFWLHIVILTSNVIIPVPIPDEKRKLTYIFTLTLLCGASKSFMKALRVFRSTTKKCENKHLG